MDRRRVYVFIAGGLFAVLAAGAALFVMNDAWKTSPELGPLGQGSAVSPSATPEVLPESSPAASLPSPDLDRPMTVTADLSEEQKNNARKEILRAVAALKQDADSQSDWLALAIYRKTIGDYDGAREIWEYTAAVRPAEAVSLHNLGNLYAFELHDLGKAETYYLQAIEREPRLGYVYYTTYEFYRYFKKDLAQAKKILDRGIAALDDQTASEFRKLRDSF